MGIVAGVSIGAAASFGGVAQGLVSLVILGAALSRYWAPTRYRMDDTGVEVVHLGWRRRHPWSRFRRVDVGPRAVVLCPLPAPSRLDAFRGLCLPCPDGSGAVARRAVRRVGAG